MTHHRCLAANEPLGNVLVTRVAKRKRSFAPNSYDFPLYAHHPLFATLLFVPLFVTNAGELIVLLNGDDYTPWKRNFDKGTSLRRLEPDLDDSLRPIIFYIIDKRYFKNIIYIISNILLFVLNL